MAAPSAARMSRSSRRRRSRSARSASQPFARAERDEGEKRVAEFGLGRAATALRRRGPVRRPAPRRPLRPCREASGRGRVTASGANAVQHARARLLLGGFRRVPVHEHLFGRGRDRTGEDVRMPAHHLLGEPTCHVVDVERVVRVAGGDLGVEEHLPEQVAELFAQVVASAVLDGIHQLGALLHEIRDERPVVDLLGPDAAIAHGAHRVGGLPQRIGHADTSLASSVRRAPMMAHPQVTRTHGDDEPRSPIRRAHPRIASSRTSGCVGECEVRQQQRHREPDAAERTDRRQIAERQRGLPRPRRRSAARAIPRP